MAIRNDPEGSFDLGMAHLQLFIKREGHSRVLRNQQEGYFALGRWVEDVRANRSQLGSHHVAMLDGLAGWDWDGTALRGRRDHDDNFARGYEELLAYVQAKGTARVPQQADGIKSELGVWVKARRMDRKWNRLSNSQMMALESLPGWVWDEQLAAFMDRVALLQAYVEQHAGEFPDARYRDPATAIPLGSWVQRQRKKYRNGDLSLERETALASIPEWS